MSEQLLIVSGLAVIGLYVTLIFAPTILGLLDQNRKVDLEWDAKLNELIDKMEEGAHFYCGSESTFVEVGKYRVECKFGNPMGFEIYPRQKTLKRLNKVMRHHVDEKQKRQLEKLFNQGNVCWPYDCSLKSNTSEKEEA